MTDFSTVGLAAPLLRAIADENYVHPTPIQSQAIPPVLAGRDLLGIAQTGTGKTAAFSLPILHRLFAAPPSGRPERGAVRALILAPTRELAGQIKDQVRLYGRYLRPRVALAIGGVSIGPQIKALAGGVDVLVATPGRLLDLKEQRAVRLDRVEVLVLDEADHMLDMGFIPAIRQIVAALPQARQNLMFSATMPRDIEALADKMLRDPVRVAVNPEAKTVDRVDQRVLLVHTADKAAVLASILRGEEAERTLVFSRTKRGADKIVQTLEKAGLQASAIHGNKSQNQRERVLAEFRDGSVRVLIATDIAARGIDVAGVSHVVNYDLPNVPESYVHRIGRTARAGAAGVAISLCDTEDRPLLRAIETLIRTQIPAEDRRGQRPARTGGGDVAAVAAPRLQPAQPPASGRGRPDHAKPAHSKPSRAKSARKPERAKRPSEWAPEHGSRQTAAKPAGQPGRQQRRRGRPVAATGGRLQGHEGGQNESLSTMAFLQPARRRHRNDSFA